LAGVAEAAVNKDSNSESEMAAANAGLARPCSTKAAESERLRELLEVIVIRWLRKV
jgi:hypothetical protein